MTAKRVVLRPKWLTRLFEIVEILMPKRLIDAYLA